MRILGSVVFLLVAGGAHALLYRWGVSAIPWVRAHKRRIAIALYFYVSLGPVLRWLSALTQNRALAIAHMLLLTEVVVVAVAAIPLTAFRLVLALARRRASDSNEIKPAPSSSDLTLTRREVVEAGGGAAFLAATGAMLGWGAVRGRYDYRLEELVVRIAGLPKALDGYTIAQVSDLHVGLFVRDHQLAEGLSLVKKIRPDLLVATGDLVDFDHAYARVVARALHDIGAPDGTVAILGNHDYYAGARAVTRAVRAAGVDMLVNGGRVIRAKDGGGFALLGVDDLWAAHRGGVGPDLQAATQMVPRDAPRILLSHQPLTVDRWAGEVALQLSGHTHGGQINPGVRPLEWFVPYVAGRYDVNGTVLYVSRGFGTSGPPSRVGSPPEITKIVLISA